MHLLNHFITLTLIICIISWGCTAQKNEQNISIYRKAVYHIPDKLDILKMNDTGQFSIANIMYEGLLTVDEFLKITPSLAQSWEIAEDGKSYTFFIKNGVRFHNGDILTIKDVYRCLKGLQSKDNPSRAIFERIKAIKIQKPNSITLTLNSPYPPFLALLAGPMGKIYKRGQGPYPQGTGAFKFHQITNKQEHKVLTLRRFDHYHGKRPHIDHFQLWSISEDQAITLAQKGIIHDTSIYPSRAGLAKDHMITEFRYPASATWLFSFNMGAEPTRNIKLRKCMVLSFNKQEFIKKFLPNHQIASSFLPPILGGSNIKPMAKGNCQAFSGHSINIDMPQELSRNKEMCQYIIADYARVKIKINCNILPFSKMTQKIKAKKFQMAFLAQTLDSPDIEYFFHAFEKSSILNFSNYSSPFIDQRLKAARLEKTFPPRMQYYQSINQHLYDNFITLNISYPEYISYKHKCIEGLAIGASGENFIDYKVVKMKQNCQANKDFINNI